MGQFLPLEILAQQIAAEKDQGLRHVLCHGVFDVVHPGHLEHLQQAKAYGDVLIVALVEDEYVRKGPGRPVYSQELRAQFMNNLQCVDYVTLVPSSLAIPALQLLHPAVYCKGQDYGDLHHPFLEGFAAEKALVENYGGHVVLTNGYRSSSTTVLTAYPWMNSKAIFAWLNEAAMGTVVVIGEPILDRYIYVEPLGKSAKENLIAFTPVAGTRDFRGGALIVADDLKGYARTVSCQTENAKPVIKTRYVEKQFGQKIFSLVEEYRLSPLPAQDLAADVLVITDYGHGLITEEVARRLSQHQQQFIALTVQSNSANWGYNLLTKWPRANYVVVDQQELRLACHSQYGDIGVLAALEADRLGCQRFVVTLGHEGCLVLDQNREQVHVPAVSERVLDRMGAGDAFLAATALLAWSGAPKEIIGQVGNIAGAIKVSKLGNEPVSRQDVETWLKAHQ